MRSAASWLLAFGPASSESGPRASTPPVRVSRRGSLLRPRSRTQFAAAPRSPPGWRRRPPSGSPAGELRPSRLRPGARVGRRRTVASAATPSEGSTGFRLRVGRTGPVRAPSAVVKLHRRPRAAARRRSCRRRLRRACVEVAARLLLGVIDDTRCRLLCGLDDHRDSLRRADWRADAVESIGSRLGLIAPHSLSLEAIRRSGPPRSIELGRLDHQRRQQSHACPAPGTLTTRPRSSRSAPTRGGVDPVLQTDPDHQPAATDLADASRASSPSSSSAPSSRTQRRRAGSSTASSTASARRGRRPAPPAKVEPWSPGSSTSAASGPAMQAPIGMPAAERLGAGEHVGPDRGLLVGPERPGPPDPGLDLVEDQQRADLVAGLAGRQQRLVADRVDPALALDRLDQHRGGRSARPRRAAPSASLSAARSAKPAGIGPSASLRASPGVAARAPRRSARGTRPRS